MKTKHDITKLPKWTQYLIADFTQDQIDDHKHIRRLVEKNDALEKALASKKSLERIADLDRRILSQVNSALGDAITTELTGYQKPLSKIVGRVINDHGAEVYALVNDEFMTILAADDFRATFKEALNAKLARVLVSRMGGELEKQVNELKANPQTRALITLAISGAVAELMRGNGETKGKS